MDWYNSLRLKYYDFLRKRRAARKIYTQADLTQKLVEYRNWLMKVTREDYEAQRVKLMQQENLINELKDSQGAKKSNPRVRSVTKKRALKR